MTPFPPRPDLLAKIDAAERETYAHLHSVHGKAWEKAGHRITVAMERSPLVLRAPRLARLRRWIRRTWFFLTRGCH